jgi:hypothetical protein
MANERTHEFGIRIALGATRKAIAMTVVRSGAILREGRDCQQPVALAELEQEPEFSDDLGVDPL